MIKIINVYDAKETDFNHNGLAVLEKCIRVEVQEELNGLFELELEYPINKKWEYLIEDNIIKAPTPAGDQLFRIYHKSKTLKSIKVNARHIFYDLLDNLVEEIDIRRLSGKDALKKAMDNLAYKTNFKYFSNIDWKNNIYLDDETGDIENKNPIEVLFNLISIYGGELRRDKFNFLWVENIGQNNGVVISYGKNIKGIEDDLNRDSVITRIKPIGTDGLTLDEKYIDSPYIANYPHPKIKVIEFSDCNDYESLRRAAKEHYKKSKCDLPVLNYKIDFIELSQTEEYKDYSCLETLNLGDIVTVKHKILKIDVKQKVIKYKYDCLRNRYIGLELGNFKENLNKAFEETDDNLDKLDLDIKDTNKRLRESEKRFRSSIEKTDSRITLAVEEIDRTNTKLELTANSITADVEDKYNKTNSRITQTANSITSIVSGQIKDVDGKVRDCNSRIEQTANSLTTEINNTRDNLSSKIEQTEKNITSSVSGQIKDVDGKVRDCNSKIDQTANKIDLVVDGGEINGNALVSAINMSDRKIKMKAVNIDLDAYVTVSDLKNGRTTIDGGCIDCSTIDANEIGSRINRVSSFINFNGSYGANGVGCDKGDGKLWIYSSRGIVLDTADASIKTGNGNTVATKEWVREQLAQLNK